MKTPLYPMLTAPVYKDYLWGGRRIPQRYGRQFDGPVCAESWEVCDRPDGMSTVTNGALAGRSLRSLVEAYGQQLVGDAAPRGPFPLLIKLIDAQQRLSVQVHPNDNTAKRYGGEAKTEMWYVLDAEPGAFVYAGLQPGVDEADVRAAIEVDSLESLLVRSPARPGSAIYIPGGCLHAIGEGCLLLEVQQNSNTTYRVYDWGRLGHDGRPRDLHLEQAMQVIDWLQPAPTPVHGKIRTHTTNPRSEILKSPYFHLERIELRSPQVLPADKQTCRVLFTADGSCTLQTESGRTPQPYGTSCLVPAHCDLTVVPDPPSATLLSITRV